MNLNFLRTPSAHEVAVRRLAEAERELLNAEINARRAQHDVACLKDVVAHLRTLVPADVPKEGSD